MEDPARAAGTDGSVNEPEDSDTMGEAIFRGDQVHAPGFGYGEILAVHENQAAIKFKNGMEATLPFTQIELATEMAGDSEAPGQSDMSPQPSPDLPETDKDMGDNEKDVVDKGSTTQVDMSSRRRSR